MELRFWSLLSQKASCSYSKQFLLQSLWALQKSPSQPTPAGRMSRILLTTLRPLPTIMMFTYPPQTHSIRHQLNGESGCWGKMWEQVHQCCSTQSCEKCNKSRWAGKEANKNPEKKQDWWHSLDRGQITIAKTKKLQHSAHQTTISSMPSTPEHSLIQKKQMWGCGTFFSSVSEKK